MATIHEITEEWQREGLSPTWVKLQQAQAEFDALAADAARYRWLRDTNMTRPDMTDGSRVILAPNEVTSIWYGLPEDQWEIFGGCLQCSKGETFDAAIDAAMKGE